MRVVDFKPGLASCPSFVRIALVHAFPTGRYVFPWTDEETCVRWMHGCLGTGQNLFWMSTAAFASLDRRQMSIRRWDERRDNRRSLNVCSIFPPPFSPSLSLSLFLPHAMIDGCYRPVPLGRPPSGIEGFWVREDGR